jgi:hypothetical protein
MGPARARNVNRPSHTAHTAWHRVQPAQSSSRKGPGPDKNANLWRPATRMMLLFDEVSLHNISCRPRLGKISACSAGKHVSAFRFHST